MTSLLGKRLAVVLACLLLLAVTPAVFAAGTISVDNTVSCVTGTGQADPYSVVYCTIQDAVSDAVSSDTINVAAGTYAVPAQMDFNKTDVILAGAGASLTHVQVSGTGERFYITASGVVIRDLDIVKTDKPGVQNIIYIGASNVTVKDNTIHGQFVIGENDTSRAMVTSGGLTGLNIEGNTIYALRQPAYVSGPTTGMVQNNYVYGTKGWVLEGGDLTFTGNTWGTGATANVYDIAILGACPVGPYPDIVAMSNANNGAVIEDQRVSPAVLSVVHVDGATAYSTDLGGRYHPYASIAPAIVRVVAGGTISVAPGAYNESPTLNKSLTLKSTGGRDATTINLQTVPNYTGSMLISGQTVTVDGFTINGYDAVGSGLASTNVYVEYPATNVLLTNNRFKIGQIGSGSTGDDGIGVITAYNTSNAIASLVVTDNIFMPLSAEGQRAFYINPDVNQFTFKGNEITGKFVGRAISEAKDNLIENNTITGVGAAGSRSAGIGVWGYIDPAVYGKATIRGNTISGVATGVSILSANNVTVEQNTISQVGVGVKVQEYSAAFDPSLIEIHQNKFNSADTFAVENATATMVNAEDNWWGSACGPSGMGPGTGSAVSAQVDFAPWWITATGVGSSSGGTTIPAGASAAQQMAIIGCAGPGATITYETTTHPGGVTITTNGVTLNLNGSAMGTARRRSSSMLMMSQSWAPARSTGVVTRPQPSRFWVGRTTSH